ncbi:MAG: glycosyltransferase family 2 protein [Rhodopila sp.]|jgi:rSAM/selenodomain-associated transferase 2
MTQNVSIIIPTLNAAAFLPTTLASLAGPPEIIAADSAPEIVAADSAPEIIIADGGSTDETTAIAAAFGARILIAPRGRGTQIAAGICAASHPWLLLLHADTCLSPNWRAGAHDSTTHAGYFRFVLNSDDPRARRLERMVAWRSRVLGLPYGDQGLLIHRDLLRAVGGMKPLPLMEDVDLVRRLGRSRLLPLPADAVTAAHKWETQGYLRRSARNLLCLSLWFAGVPPGFIRRLYE